GPELAFRGSMIHHLLRVGLALVLPAGFAIAQTRTLRVRPYFDLSATEALYDDNRSSAPLPIENDNIAHALAEIAKDLPPWELLERKSFNQRTRRCALRNR